VKFFKRKSAIGHLEEKVISLYLDDALNPGTIRMVKNHLTSCAHCRVEVSEFQDTIKLLRGVPQMPEPRSFMIHVPVLSSRQLLRLPLLWMRGAAVAAAMVLMVIIGVDGSGVFDSNGTGVPVRLGLQESALSIRSGSEYNGTGLVNQQPQEVVEQNPLLEQPEIDASADARSQPNENRILNYWILELCVGALLISLIGLRRILPRRLWFH